MQLHIAAAVNQLLVVGLRDREQVAEYFGMAFQLSAMDLESGASRDYDDVAIMKPEV